MLPIQFVLEKDLFQSITVKIVVIRLTDCLIAGAATFIQPFEVLESGDPLERLRVCAAGCGEPDSGETRTRIRDCSVGKRTNLSERIDRFLFSRSSFLSCSETLGTVCYRQRLPSSMRHNLFCTPQNTAPHHEFASRALKTYQRSDSPSPSCLACQTETRWPTTLALGQQCASRWYRNIISRLTHFLSVCVVNPRIG